MIILDINQNYKYFMFNKVCLKFKIKNFNILVIYLYDIKEKNIYKTIKNKIKNFSYFFKKMPCIINIKYLSEEDQYFWKYFHKKLSNLGLCIIGVSGCNNKIWEKIITRNGLLIFKEQINKKIFYEKKNKITKINNNYIIDKPIRSGQTIYAKKKNLIIMNTVNSGAEVIADGDIHIYGIMRGRASAGASKDTKSQIFCTKLYAEFISIAGKNWINENVLNSYLGKPVRFYIKNDILTIQKFSL
ncbi:minC [Wigglesworthia glossinidia endosymbiont of Glossina brevipalpis]|uniref:Probable septum site-determining protein MinC n=1 Tax=Wigglesworthia glossinidia brevipalpis TaxID=36870 RepID=MINC_WIGBR|nr:RecName: Full=Probable septum site-determining protein MinC [Wigglesworthia glossinidia endosymbiont of Glossina brevipalpis]BAC24521.1 minC [Wigglesworthia glossinidia endosymbiont of Glossina brevipalpis]